MKKIISFLFNRTNNEAKKDRETLRREYEESTASYDHYVSYGSAFANFCSRK